MSNGNTALLWRSIVVTVLIAMLGLGTWLLNEAHSVPEKYTSKIEHKEDIKRIEVKIDNQTNELRQEFRDVRKLLNQMILSNNNG